MTAAVPFTEMEGMLSYKGTMQPIQVSGVDPALEGKVSIVAQHIVQGRLDALKPGEFGVVIGEITARRFRLNVGDKITLIVPEVSTAPGGITPRMQRLNVVGVFKVGAELDGSMALIHVADAAQMQHWAAESGAERAPGGEGFVRRAARCRATSLAGWAPLTRLTTGLTPRAVCSAR